MRNALRHQIKALLESIGPYKAHQIEPEMMESLNRLRDAVLKLFPADAREVMTDVIQPAKKAWADDCQHLGKQLIAALDALDEDDENKIFSN